VFTTMTYNDGWHSSPFGLNNSATSGGQSTPMALDVALLQERYGANPNTGSGNTSYNLLSIASSYRAIWDVSGADTISFTGALAATIDLRAATLQNAIGGGGYVSYVNGVHGGFTIANGVVIENATGGSGADVLIGNAAANILDGGAGADSMLGGGGDDTFFVDNAGDTTSDDIDGGSDIVFASATHTMGANIENLTLTGSSFINGSGNALANVITGNSGGNALAGLGGNDTLIGNDGNDQLNGGDGDDTLLGGDGVDTLLGGANNDSLDGGIGADAMSGGAGDDTYFVDNAGDGVTENVDEGTDTVRTALTYMLGANVENLVLTGSNAVDGTGNALNNNITGNGQNNTLLGGDGADTLQGGAGNDVLDGGAGADTMFGSTGDDIFYVDNANDVTGEGSAVGGTDLIYSTVRRQIGTNIENLTLIGTASVNGIGNPLDNLIIGNVGDNILSGNNGNDTLYGMDGSDDLHGGNNNDYLDGGTGADNMYGGLGDDTFVVDNTGDITGEGNVAGGIDTILSSVTRQIGTNIENLTLTGTANINGTGNPLNNVIIGNSGNNTLVGNNGNDTLSGGDGDDTLSGGNDNDTLDGGLGADQLTGGLGADTFVFSTALGAGNIDTIVNFSAAADTIRLDTTIFAAIPNGVLDANAFVIGSAAADADDRIIYDSATGALYYDADGDGAGAAIHFATLATGLALTQDDFLGFGG
jgi:Ca2+-binding RTX toxin-like protein